MPLDVVTRGMTVDPLRGRAVVVVHLGNWHGTPFSTVTLTGRQPQHRSEEAGWQGYRRHDASLSMTSLCP